MKRTIMDPPLATIGLWVSSTGGAVRGALIASQGRGLDRRIEIAAHAAVVVPEPVRRMFRDLESGAEPSPLPGGPLAACLADLQASAVDELLLKARMPRQEVLAVGVHDPGRWSTGPDGMTIYEGLCDAARLAEAAGVNVLDAFPARDLAAGGLGGPITALAEWVLLRHPQRTRALVTLGRVTRITWLAAEGASGVRRVLAFDAGPGLQLLDAFTQKLTGGAQAFDPGGHLAVQGRLILELLERWMEAPCLADPLPRWRPRGLPPDPFVDLGVRMAVDRRWSLRDVLCTATHFAAAAVARSLARDLPGDAQCQEIIVAGGGQHNGLLLRELRRASGETPIVASSAIGIPSEALAPAAVAVLAALWLDQTPGSDPAVTGADLPRVLGRLTPGPPQSFRRLVDRLGSSRHTVGPLQATM
jgi:anhydro-N-acetylmuramic acid kinase